MASFHSKVKQFTEESKGVKLPLIPEKMDEEEVKFLIQMCLSELVELAETVTESPDKALEFVKNCFGVDKHKETTVYNNDIQIIADQADAAADVIVYLHNAYAKKGVDLSKVLDLVHEANMDKRDPITKKFISRESDGKILKRDGWLAADINGEIERQINEGRKLIEEVDVVGKRKIVQCDFPVSSLETLNLKSES